MDTFSEIVEAFEEAGIKVRELYWAEDQSPFYVVLDGQRYRVGKVEMDGDAIVVTLDPGRK